MNICSVNEHDIALKFGIKYGVVPSENEWVHLKRFSANKPNELYMYRKNSIEHYVVVDGEICVNGIQYGVGTVLTYGPKERRNYFVISDTCFASIMDPESRTDELMLGNILLDDFIEPYSCDSSNERYNDILNNEISVVLQGAVSDIYTPLAIESIKRYLPGAKIIISTWEGMCVDNLQYDKVIFNKDPGAPFFIKPNGEKHIDNRNRLLVSTQGGIQAVDTKYTLKMRSDCILFGDGVVRCYGKYPNRTGKYNLFKSKLVVGEQCNVRKLKFKELSRPYLFHISDWFVFGLTEDIKTYFIGTAIEAEEQILGWKYKKCWPIPEDDGMGRSASPRYNAEQYYFLSAMKRKYVIEYEDASDYSEEAESVSDYATIDNFEILNIREHQIINAKRQMTQPWDVNKSSRAEYFTNKTYEDKYKELTL